MSVKLYEGALIDGHSLESFLPELRKLRGEFLAQADDIARRFVVRMAVNQWDRQCHGLKTGEDSLHAHVLTAQTTLMDRQLEVESSGKSDPSVDFSADVTLCPVKGKLLALPFIQHPGLRDIWQAQPWLQEYGYWDNTDPPDDVAEADWSQRASDWDEAFELYSGHAWTAAQCGYSFRLLPVHGGGFPEVTAAQFHELAPDRATRAKALALELHLKELKSTGQPLPKGRVALRAYTQSAPTLDAEVALTRQLADLEPGLR